MVRVKIDSDEWYPVYFVSDYGKEVEISEELHERITNATKEFDAVQDILKTLDGRRR